jgi:glucose/galactose transporter
MSTTSTKKSYIGPLLIGILFFIFGFVTWVNATLIPYLQTACELTPSEAVLVTFASYIAYAVMAFPSSWILSKTGFKNGMMLGLFIMAIGALIFIPAAHSRTFSTFLTGLFFIGIGMALLQTAANPYITILGPIESAAKRISIMGICNKGAAAIAPLIMGAILLNGMDKFKNIEGMALSQKNILLDELASKIIFPYIVIAAVFIVLAIFIRFSSLPDIKNEEESKEESTDAALNNGGSRKSLFSYPYLWLGFISIFVYVGAEVAAGDLIQLYGNTGLKIPLEITRHFTTYTMLGMLAGYLLGIVLIPKIISQQTALKIAAILGIVFSLGVIYAPGIYSIAFLAALGFANAPMWPAIWPLSIHGLGRFLKTGSALLIVGIAGGAIIPRLWTLLSEHTSMQSSFWILIPCYLFILYFAIKGHKIGKTVKNG